MEIKPNNIYFGDCYELIKDMKDNSVDLIMTDPPYDIQGIHGSGILKTRGHSPSFHKQLEVMELYMPNERKQCEYIWKPVYDEYRRLNYRLKKVEKVKLF